MLKAVGVQSLDELIEQVVPHDIRLPKRLALPEPVTEWQYLEEVRSQALRNKVYRSLIGRG